MSLMLDEIHEQPDIIQRLIRDARNDVDVLSKAIKEQGIEQLCFAARGTSDNAAVFGKYLIGITSGLMVSHAAASMFTLYNAKFNLSRWLFMGISQSGESPDVVSVIDRSREMGAVTAGITNTQGSPLTKVSDYTLLCHAGEEKSVAATKTYIATLALIYLLAERLSGQESMVDDLKRASEAIRAVFTLEDYIAKIVEQYRDMNQCMVIARGLNQATCQEVALKLSETCYVVAKPHSGADLMHGPIAAVDEGFPVIVFAVPGKTLDFMKGVVRKLEGSNADMIIVSSDDEILSRARTPIKIPMEVNELCSPMIYAVAGQLFAQYLSHAKGFNCDQPRGLQKVTKTL